ncbi:hypothetical protein CNC04030 [Cryptococcus deneoformans JEC21]|uniref:BD-FAE-like domain-containing protein n=1 Tax=Cryptococcus deneoformans (strain JEC21 / ATCC MYA-565) TaxID=214684 RepID=Q5KK72_CRYD1|nr:hypothetical protein CNC04030 [Cryptococcus neoformans var. neoformans JEC21]AAW42699.2 hypothetical protein CNC04030 [Cryptococcus neoformans var. neoformans JEC21]
MPVSAQNSPARPSIRETIAARRAELRNTPKSQRTGDLQTYGSPAGKRAGTPRGFVHLDGSGADLLEDKTVEGQLKKAAKSGKLDIASLELERIPPKVYISLLGLSTTDLSNPPPPPSPPRESLAASRSRTAIGTSPFAVDDEIDVDNSQQGLAFRTWRKEEDIWSEPEELTTLRIGNNKLVEIDREIGMFGGLKILDLSKNLLKGVPDALSDLLRLSSLDLSHNSLPSIPRSVLLLPQLQVLDISHNSITTLSFDSPIGPSEEGLRYGSGFFTTAIQRQTALKSERPILPVLRHLSLGSNTITQEGLKALASVNLKHMRVLNIENNNVSGVLDVQSLGISEKAMPELSHLVLSGNINIRGLIGTIASAAKVDTIGCNLRQATPSFNHEDTSTVEDNQDKASSAVETGPAANDEHTLPIPEPDLTIVYRTFPAATFDSEPLAVDFDLYLPSTPAGPSGHPLVIWFHGGGLLQGNKENLPPHFRRLPSHAYTRGDGRPDESVAIISPNYRLAPQVSILDILSEVTVLFDYIQTRLNDRLVKDGKGDHKIDVSRICLSGGSAGGYLALIAGLRVPDEVGDEEIGAYRGLKNEAIKCLAPFYPITDLTDKFWATETNPVPWMNGNSISHAQAKPHIDTKAAPVCSAVSGGPRSILYPYMLQHSLFPSLLFLTQRSVGQGLDAFRPSPLSLSIPHRLEIASKSSKAKYHVPIFFVYGTIDDKVQPMEKTIEALGRASGDLVIERVEGADHAFDEDPKVECQAFQEWLGKTLL